MNLVSYELSEADKSDICKKLKSVLMIHHQSKSIASISEIKCFTPFERKDRAKSFLLTTRASKDQPTNIRSPHTSTKTWSNERTFEMLKEEEEYSDLDA